MGTSGAGRALAARTAALVTEARPLDFRMSRYCSCLYGGKTAIECRRRYACSVRTLLGPIDATVLVPE